MKRGDFTEKQKSFIAEYLKDSHGKNAAIRAGYAPKNAEVTASKLLIVPKVAAKIAQAKAKVFQRSEITFERWLKEMEVVGFSDMGDFAKLKVVEGGKNDGEEKVEFTPTDKLPEGESRAIQEISQKTTFTKNGSRQVEVNVRLHEKRGVLMAYGKARGWVVDRTLLGNDPEHPLTDVSAMRQDLEDRIARIIDARGKAPVLPKPPA